MHYLQGTSICTCSTYLPSTSKEKTEKRKTLTLSLWKGRKTNRPRNKSAPVLREIVRAVFAAQVVLAADDFTTEIRLPNDLRSLTLTKSTLFSHLNPAKEACTPPMAPAFLLTDRRPPKDAAQAAILLKKCVERCTRSRKEILCLPKKHESSDNTVVAVAFTSSRPFCTLGWLWWPARVREVQFHAQLYTRRFVGYSNTTGRQIPGAHAAAHSFSGLVQEISTSKTSCPPDVSPGGLKSLI